MIAQGDLFSQVVGDRPCAAFWQVLADAGFAVGAGRAFLISVACDIALQHETRLFFSPCWMALCGGWQGPVFVL